MQYILHQVLGKPKQPFV